MKKTLSLVLAILTVAALCVSLASCGNKSLEDKLLGTWTASISEEGMTVETEFTFEKEGKAKMTSMGMSVDATWKVVDDKTIEMTMSILGQESTNKLTVAFDGDSKVTMTDSTGDPMTFTKK